MTLYDPLIAVWNTTGKPVGVSGTDLADGMTAEQKLAAINGWTVAGPKVDVQVSTVFGELMLSGAYLTLVAFSASPGTNDTTHDTALACAKMLVAMIGSPNAPPFRMSDPTKYAQLAGMLGAILAQETAAAGSTGLTQAVHDAVLALSASPTVSWCQANGLPADGVGKLWEPDLENAGLI